MFFLLFLVEKNFSECDPNWDMMWLIMKNDNIASMEKILILKRYVVIVCTILTSDSELIDSTYIVTPTSTGGPEIRIALDFVCNIQLNFWFSVIVFFVLGLKYQAQFMEGLGWERWILWLNIM